VVAAPASIQMFSREMSPSRSFGAAGNVHVGALAGVGPRESGAARPAAP
jgi:hypothetical protein